MSILKEDNETNNCC